MGKFEEKIRLRVEIEKKLWYNTTADILHSVNKGGNFVPKRLAKGTAVKILSQQPMQISSKQYAAIRKYSMRKIRYSNTAIVLNGKIGSKIIIGVTNDAPTFCIKEVKKGAFR